MMVLVKKDVTQSGGILEESNDYLCLLWREIKMSSAINNSIAKRLDFLSILLTDKRVCCINGVLTLVCRMVCPSSWAHTTR